MVSVTRNVDELAANEREFYENVLGQKLEGQQRVIVQLLDVAVGAEGGANGRQWTDDKNIRRAELIDKEIAGTLSPAETAELVALQQAMLAYRRSIAPLPLDDARKLHNELLRKHGDTHVG